MKPFTNLFFATLFTAISATSINAQCIVSQHCFNTNAIDNSNSGNDGVVHGAKLDNGKAGVKNTSYYFDGSSYISLPVSNYLGHDEFTYSAWVKPTALPQSGDAKVIASIGNFGQDQMFGIFNSTSQNTVGFCLSTYDNFGVSSNTCTGNLPNINQWYHVTFTRDKNSAKLYIDGALSKTVFYNNSTAGYGPSSVAYIGARYNNNQKWIGNIDNFNVYSCALDATEVLSEYNSINCDPDTCFYTVYDTITYIDTLVYTDTIIVYDTISVPLNVQSESGKAHKTLVFPNPSNSHVVVDLSKSYQDVYFRIEGVNGQLIQEEKLGFTSKFVLDSLPNKKGIYFLSIFSSGVLVDKVKLIRD